MVMGEYGYILIAVLVNEVTPADKIFRAMNAVESYKRLRQATYDQAEAEKFLIVKRAEAECERKRLQGVGVSWQRKALVRGMEKNMQRFLGPTAAPGQYRMEDFSRELDDGTEKATFSPRADAFTSFRIERSTDVAAAAAGGSASSNDPASASAEVGGGATSASSGLARPTLIKRGTMALRVEEHSLRSLEALGNPANLLRMPTDVGVSDTDTLFPEAARFHRREAAATTEGDGDQPGEYDEGFAAGDVMELLLITNYFDMLKDIGQGDSASTLYVPNSPAIVGTLRREIQEHFGTTKTHGKEVIIGAKRG